MTTPQDQTKNTDTTPHDIDLEQVFLGSLMYDNKTFEDIGDYFHADYFYHPTHQAIYTHTKELIQQGYIATSVTVWAAMKDHAGLKASGGDEYLKALISLASNASGRIDTYGLLLYELFGKRELIKINKETLDEVINDSLSIGGIESTVESLEKKLFQLTEHHQKKEQGVKFGDVLYETLKVAETAFKNTGHIVGVTSGLRDLDNKLGGFHNSDLIVLAARPSMGKSALAMNIAFSAAKQHMKTKGKEGARVAVFSLEMSSQQLALRLLGQETGIPSDKIRRGAIKSEDFFLFSQVAQELNSIPMWIDDTAALSFENLRKRVRRLHRVNGIGIIIIDYLQLLNASSKGKHHENRVQELSEITRGLKSLAKEINVPVIALSQLSRAVEQREDKQPLLSDLRESGTIEQDADVVMFIYRAEYYVSRTQPPEGSEKMAAWQKEMQEVHGKANIIIAKQRHGPIGHVEVLFDAQRTKFDNVAL